MGALVLALWALLVSLDPAGGAREPGEDGPLGCGGSWGRWAHPAATALSWVRSALLRGAGAAPQGRT